MCEKWRDEEKNELSSLFCACECHMLPWKMPFCFPCPTVLPVFLCRPLVSPPFLNNYIPLSVRLCTPNTYHHPMLKSLTAKTKKELSEIGAPSYLKLKKKEKRLANQWISPRKKTEWTFKWMNKRLEWCIVDGGRRGGMCYEMMCSEWIVSRAASEGGDGGEKVWGRQKSVVMRRRKKRKKQNRFSIAEFLDPPFLYKKRKPINFKTLLLHLPQQDLL